MNLAIIGDTGRVGRKLIDACADEGHHVVLRKNSQRVIPSDSVPAIDAIVCVGHREAVAYAVELGRTTEAAVLICSSGLNASDNRDIDALASSNVVVVAPNLSLGNYLQHKALKAIAAPCALLAPSYDLDVIDRHPITKRDAPSATALAMAEAARKAGFTNVRVDSIRAGLPVSTHEAVISFAGQSITISHHVSDLSAPLSGIWLILSWLADNAPGAGKYYAHEIYDRVAGAEESSVEESSDRRRVLTGTV